MKQKTKEQLYRFVKTFDPNQCWNFQGTCNRGGYGIIKLNQKRFFAHRYSFEVHFGIFDYNLKVCHKCDNTKCVNPFHLFLGTQQDNLADMCIKKRNQRHEKHHRARLTMDQARAIRQMCKDTSLSHSEIGHFFNIGREAVSKIHQGIRWKED